MSVGPLCPPTLECGPSTPRCRDPMSLGQAKLSWGSFPDKPECVGRSRLAHRWRRGCPGPSEWTIVTM